ncbi:MAG TPA: uracil-DNA glycosylase [Parachlamydiaceae bacterium]|nr:uracil-DNA glycosylase [Parachlamydiaceae bacterium]
MNTPAFDIELSWNEVLKEELKAPYLAELAAFLQDEVSGQSSYYPPKENLFNAFSKTPYHQVKVVILGQDPYHGPSQAHGLSFSVPRGMPLPPSLRNIFKELHSDLEIPAPKHGCLDAWAEQGVFLLNAILTVRQNTPLSHQKKGWEQFTDAVINKLIERKEPIVFLLWGMHAQEKFAHFADTSDHHHLVLIAAHPSPFSAYRGFLGCRHFSQANDFLAANGITPIDWRI